MRICHNIHCSDTHLHVSVWECCCPLGGTGTACSIEYAHGFVVICLSWWTQSSSFFTLFFFSYRLWLLHWHCVNAGNSVILKRVGKIKWTNTKPYKGRPLCMFLCVDCSYTQLGMLNTNNVLCLAFTGSWWYIQVFAMKRIHFWIWENWCW